MVSKERIGQTLNTIDRAMQRILITGETRLKTKQQETFTDKLWELRRERKYWRVLLHPRKALTKEALGKIWKGHKEGDLRMTRLQKKDRLAQAQLQVEDHYR